MLAGEQELYSRWKREVKELSAAGVGELQIMGSSREKGSLKVVLQLGKNGLQEARKVTGPGSRQQR
jgi:hypothetical protein